MAAAHMIAKLQSLIEYQDHNGDEGIVDTRPSRSDRLKKTQMLDIDSPPLPLPTIPLPLYYI